MHNQCFIVSQDGAVKDKVTRTREMRNHDKIVVVDQRKEIDHWIKFSRFCESGK
jgi:hypothetical protein